jgi:hypothetical protein
MRKTAQRSRRNALKKVLFLELVVAKNQRLGLSKWVAIAGAASQDGT